MPKRAGGRDFAPRVRSIVDRVVEKLEKGGDADRLLEDQLREDYVGTLAKLAHYTTKQIDVTTTTLEEFVMSKAQERDESDSVRH